LKRGWMRLWLGISAVLLALSGIATVGRPTAKHASSPRRVNELTLAGLQPGKDTVAKAILKYKAPLMQKNSDREYSWNDECRHEILHADFEPSKKVQEIRVVAGLQDGKFECAAPPRSPWRTGKNLALGDAQRRVIELYGEPDSRSPSTKDGQRLELLYYAFDWAGPDVPQVMEVLCTVEKDGMPGRVVEITLAASSL
jgi:hypothetical protein